MFRKKLMLVCLIISLVFFTALAGADSSAFLNSVQYRMELTKYNADTDTYTVTDGTAALMSGLSEGESYKARLYVTNVTEDTIQYTPGAQLNGRTVRWDTYTHAGRRNVFFCIPLSAGTNAIDMYVDGEYLCSASYTITDDVTEPSAPADSTFLNSTEYLMELARSDSASGKYIALEGTSADMSLLPEGDSYLMRFKVTNTSADELRYTVSAVMNGNEYPWEQYTHAGKKTAYFYLSLPAGSSRVSIYVDGSYLCSETYTITDDTAQPEEATFRNTAGYELQLTRYNRDTGEYTVLDGTIASLYGLQEGEAYNARLYVTNETANEIQYTVSSDHNGNAYTWDPCTHSGHKYMYFGVILSQGVNTVKMYVDGTLLCSGTYTILQDEQVLEISLPSVVEIRSGEPVQLTAAVTTPDNSYTNRLVTFESSDESVVTVDADGILRGISTGTATVKATSESGVSAECVVISVPDPGKVMTLPGRLAVLGAGSCAGTASECVIINSGCAAIGAKAFAGCANLKLVYIPASVTSIADDAFERCGDITIAAEPGSFASEWAAGRGISCVIIQ